MWYYVPKSVEKNMKGTKMLFVLGTYDQYHLKLSYFPTYFSNYVIVCMACVEVKDVVREDEMVLALKTIREVVISLEDINHV